MNSIPPSNKNIKSSLQKPKNDKEKPATLGLPKDPNQKKGKSFSKETPKLDTKPEK